MKQLQKSTGRIVDMHEASQQRDFYLREQKRVQCELGSASSKLIEELHETLSKHDAPERIIREIHQLLIEAVLTVRWARTPQDENHDKPTSADVREWGKSATATKLIEGDMSLEDAQRLQSYRPNAMPDYGEIPISHVIDAICYQITFCLRKANDPSSSCQDALKIYCATKEVNSFPELIQAIKSRLSQ